MTVGWANAHEFVLAPERALQAPLPTMLTRGAAQWWEKARRARRDCNAGTGAFPHPTILDE
jgi:hypothetical protein